MLVTLLAIAIPLVIVIALIDVLYPIRARLLGWKRGNAKEAEEKYGAENFEAKMIGSRIRGEFKMFYREKR